MRHLPSITPSKAYIIASALLASEGSMQTCGGWGSTEVTKCRVFAESTDLGVSAISSLVEMKGKLKTFFKHKSVQGMMYYERLASFGRNYAKVRELEMDRGYKSRFSAESGDLGHFVLG